MLGYGAASIPFNRSSMICSHQRQVVVGVKGNNVGRKNPAYPARARTTRCPATTRFIITTAAVVILSVVGANAAEIRTQPQEQVETLSNIPQILSGECVSDSSQEDCIKKGRIQRPKSRKAESCTVKCVTTCIRGGDGSPGEGPLNVRKPLVVFKQGFRTRQYCLVECSDICNLIRDGDDGP